MRTVRCHWLLGSGSCASGVPHARPRAIASARLKRSALGRECVAWSVVGMVLSAPLDMCMDLFTHDEAAVKTSRCRVFI